MIKNMDVMIYGAGKLMSKENEPLLSVVVPVYNVEPYLERCIQSILNQTYKNLEVILVDDGSTDKSGSVCDEYAHRDERVIVIHKQNGGQSSARKAGAAIATGSYITAVDSDDWIESNMFEEMMGAAVKSGADVVSSGMIKDYGNHCVPGQDLIPAGFYDGDNYRQNVLDKLINLEEFFERRLDFCIWGRLYKKDLYIEFQNKVPNVIKILEDYAVVFPLLYKAKSLFILPKNYYHYCVRADSICGVVKNDYEGQKVFEQYFKNILSFLPDTEITQKQVSLIIAYSKSFTTPDAFFSVKNGILYPYGVAKDKKILVYGGGKFGQRLKTFLQKYPEFNVVAYTDKANIEGYVSVEEALKKDYDVIIIAIALASSAKSAVQDLIDFGVKKEKIKTIDVNYILQQKIPQEKTRGGVTYNSNFVNRSAPYLEVAA